MTERERETDRQIYKRVYLTNRESNRQRGREIEKQRARDSEDRDTERERKHDLRNAIRAK